MDAGEGKRECRTLSAFKASQLAFVLLSECHHRSSAGQTRRVDFNSGETKVDANFVFQDLIRLSFSKATTTRRSTRRPLTSSSIISAWRTRTAVWPPRWTRPTSSSSSPSRRLPWRASSYRSAGLSSEVHHFIPSLPFLMVENPAKPEYHPLYDLHTHTYTHLPIKRHPELWIRSEPWIRSAPPPPVCAADGRPTEQTCP